MSGPVYPKPTGKIRKKKYLLKYGRRHRDLPLRLIVRVDATNLVTVRSGLEAVLEVLDDNFNTKDFPGRNKSLRGHCWKTTVLDWVDWLPELSEWKKKQNKRWCKRNHGRRW